MAKFPKNATRESLGCIKESVSVAAPMDEAGAGVL
jgi:hypothetical protein